LFFWLTDKAYSTIDTGNSKLGDILAIAGVIELIDNISISSGIPSGSPFCTHSGLLAEQHLSGT
jgi:formate hydrogenlyase subunit 4